MGNWKVFSWIIFGSILFPFVSTNRPTFEDLLGGQIQDLAEPMAIPSTYCMTGRTLTKIVKKYGPFAIYWVQSFKIGKEGDPIYGKLEWTKERPTQSFVYREADMLSRSRDTMPRKAEMHKIGLIPYLNFIQDLKIKMGNESVLKSGFSGLFTIIPSQYLYERSINTMLKEKIREGDITIYFEKLVYALICCQEENHINNLTLIPSLNMGINDHGAKKDRYIDKWTFIYHFDLSLGGWRGEKGQFKHNMKLNKEKKPYGEFPINQFQNTTGTLGLSTCLGRDPDVVQVKIGIILTILDLVAELSYYTKHVKKLIAQLGEANAYCRIIGTAEIYRGHLTLTPREEDGNFQKIFDFYRMTAKRNWKIAGMENIVKTLKKLFNRNDYLAYEKAKEALNLVRGRRSFARGEPAKVY